MKTKITTLLSRLIVSLFIFCNFASCLLAQSRPSETVWDTIVTGHFTKDEVRKKILYIPINVPEGITAFNMQASITDPTDDVVDIGLFDERGINVEPVNGFRGWAGGVSSKQVNITKENATSSYITGRVNKGIWNVMLVPTNIKTAGYNWQLKVSLEYAVAWWNDMLKRGLVKTAIGASNSHRADSKNIVSHPQTVVYAKGLNRNAITAGIQKGNCYISENSNVSVSFEVSSPLSKQVCISGGDTISVNKAAKLTVGFTKQGTSDSIKVILISNNGTEHVFNKVKSNSVLRYNLPVEDLEYIRAEVREEGGGMVALTNPIWIKK